MEKNIRERESWNGFALLHFHEYHLRFCRFQESKLSLSKFRCSSPESTTNQCVGCASHPNFGGQTGCDDSGNNCDVRDLRGAQPLRKPYRNRVEMAGIQHILGLLLIMLIMMMIIIIISIVTILLIIIIIIITIISSHQFEKHHQQPPFPRFRACHLAPLKVIADSFLDPGGLDGPQENSRFPGFSHWKPMSFQKIHPRNSTHKCTEKTFDRIWISMCKRVRPWNLTYTAPEKWCLEDYLPFGKGAIFRGYVRFPGRRCRIHISPKKEGS